jgi:lipopolysaccharide export system permease protein
MRLLTRYTLRQLVAPFLFALAALTGFMLLNQVAKRFGNLVGKGLPWRVIAEVFVLSLPFIIAMTLPMAVLVAVLYALAHLAADNEITAMRASGIGIGRVLGPLLAWGVIMTAANFAFVDQVLPRSNARLRALLIDIGRKKPTFSLREQAINEIPPSQYFLRAARIEGGTGRLRSVAIYDLGSPATRRVIYADSGIMGYAPNGTDLSLRLYHGTIHQLRGGEPDLLRLTAFTTSEIRVKDVFDRLQRGEDVSRGDRELSTCEMLAVVDSARRDLRAARQDIARSAAGDLRFLLRLAPAPPPPEPDTALRLPRYCGWLRRLGALPVPVTAQARGSAQTPANVLRTPPGASPARLSTWAEVIAAGDRARESQRRIDRYEVEIHKKWAISVACFVFVLVGVTLALRFPRGGMGLVIGGGAVTFALYYIGLTAGESLADRALMSPWLSMWLPNILLGAAGVAGVMAVSRELGSTRGGDWNEIRGWLRRLPRRRRTA